MRGHAGRCDEQGTYWRVLEGVPLALPQAHRWVVWPWRGIATKRSVQNGGGLGRSKRSGASKREGVYSARGIWGTGGTDGVFPAAPLAQQIQFPQSTLHIM